MKKIKSVTIYKPMATASFEVGAKLILGEKETEATVTRISVGIFNSVRVSFSSGMVIFYKGFPISYE